MGLIFLGTSEFAVEPLRQLVANGIAVDCVVTQPDKKRDRGKKIKGTPVKEVALELDLTVYQPENVNTAESVDFLKKFNADFLVVIAYGQLLSEQLLAIPSIVPLNVHGSLLPKYRGAAPIERAVIAGERVTGVTLIKVVKALDAGEMYLKREMEISDTMTSGDVESKLKVLGAQILIKGIQALQNGELTGIVQNSENATYAHKITKEDRYIAFNSQGKDIINLVRGLQPRTFALAFYKGEPLGICKAVYEPINLLGEMGEIIKIDKKKGILVQCKVGGIFITKLKPSGKKVMDFKAYLNGNPLNIGEKLKSSK